MWLAVYLLVLPKSPKEAENLENLKRSEIMHSMFTKANSINQSRVTITVQMYTSQSIVARCKHPTLQTLLNSCSVFVDLVGLDSYCYTRSRERFHLFSLLMECAICCVSDGKLTFVEQGY